MADKTTVNEQVTDSVTEAEAVGESQPPAQAPVKLFENMVKDQEEQSTDNGIAGEKGISDLLGLKKRR
ncbi:hypothetical protein [Kordiimonas gwangyangensis]|uniref:hypothetical protein n=1 Tax=Kordiimonas gwangyangensis TaxID=288022 RepID=UPI0003634ACE|nr:hypothetical protein [Kordiimonas gwangyangensis]